MFKPDREILQDVCRGIALENYGFVYLSDDKEEIRARYESQGGGDGIVGSIKNAVGGRSIGVEELQETLEEIASDDLNEFERLRTGVYFYDPANAPGESDVAKTLEQLFKYDIVVSERELKSRFNLAKKDIDFFTGRLEQEEYLKRITTSEHGDYFTIGPQLKDESGDAGVDARLKKKAKHGLLTHADLESVIDAAATSDVIRYLEHEEFIIQLEGKYLVRSGVDEFAEHVARGISDRVDEAFEGTAYVLPKAELSRIVENEVSAEFDVLEHLNASDRDWVLEHVHEAVVDELELDDDPRSVVVRTEPFEEYVDRRAAEVLGEVDDPSLGTADALREAGHERIEELNLSNTEAADEYIHERMEAAYDERVDEMFNIASGGSE